MVRMHAIVTFPTWTMLIESSVLLRLCQNHKRMPAHSRLRSSGTMKCTRGLQQTSKKGTGIGGATLTKVTCHLLGACSFRSRHPSYHWVPDNGWPAATMRRLFVWEHGCKEFDIIADGTALERRVAPKCLRAFAGSWPLHFCSQSARSQPDWDMDRVDICTPYIRGYEVNVFAALSCLVVENFHFAHLLVLKGRLQHRIARFVASCSP